MNMKAALLAALAVFTAAYIAIWLRAIIKRRHSQPAGTGGSGGTMPDVRGSGIGFFANFLDTLGIGSFATTTAFFKLWGLVRDEEIPGTLNVGHTLPTIAEAFIYVAVIEVDFMTMVLLIAAACVGSWLGAGIVSRWPRRKVQIGMGAALLVAAIVMFMKQLDWLPGGGESLGLSGTKLAIGIVGNFMLGALMTLGIGLYAPCMILIAMLGMNARAAYPIMMGSCAFLMPVGSTRFVKTAKYNLKSALGLTLGGIPGVLIAAYVVKELPLTYVRWLVVVVVLYTAAMMLRSAWVERGKKQAGALPAEAPGD